MMSGRQVRALYDFEGQTENGELSLRTGDVLTVARTDVGEGWWEGSNAHGQAGLFPEAYVEAVSEEELEGPPPSIAPPPLPADYNTAANKPAVVEPTASGDDSWGLPGWGLPPPPRTTGTTRPTRTGIAISMMMNRPLLIRRAASAASADRTS